MMLSADDAPALPLWINGHAFLTVVDQFFDIARADGGEILRRTPLCGAEPVAAAVAAARAALPAWAASSAAQRQQVLDATAASLAGYAQHFAKLIGEETGKDSAAAAAEVAAAVAVLRHCAADILANPQPKRPAVLGLLGDAGEPLLAAAALIGPALAAGATLVVKPSPRAPSCGLALAELLTRAGLADGVCNVVHGDDAAVAALAGHADLALLAFAGDSALAVKIAALSERHGKRLFATPVAQATHTWPQALAEQLN